jgi:hypothetical protein
MTNWYCDSFCKISQDGAGPWDDGNLEFFSKIKSAHSKCIGFQKGEPKLTGKANWGFTEIEKEATNFLLSHWDEWLHEVIAYYKPDKVCLIKDKAKWVNQK